MFRMSEDLATPGLRLLVGSHDLRNSDGLSRNLTGVTFASLQSQLLDREKLVLLYSDWDSPVPYPGVLFESDDTELFDKAVKVATTGTNEIWGFYAFSVVSVG